MRRVVGVIGPIGSGKDVAAAYISTKLGFPCFQISAPIKDVARERGIVPTRENLVELGTLLACEFGSHYLAEVLLGRMDVGGIITGMRQLAQIQYLREHARLSLIALDAFPQIRFDRSRERGKIGEALTLEEFTQNEINENSGHHVQRLFECMKLADYRIENNADLDNLYAKLDGVISRLTRS